MASGQQGRGTIALIGVIAIGVVVALFGVLRWNPIELGPAAAPPVKPPQAATPAPNAAVAPTAVAARRDGGRPSVQPGPSAGAVDRCGSRRRRRHPSRRRPPLRPQARPPSLSLRPSTSSASSRTGTASSPVAALPAPPSRCLRDGQVHARTPADPSGPFRPRAAAAAARLARDRPAIDRSRRHAPALEGQRHHRRQRGQAHAAPRRHGRAGQADGPLVESGTAGRAAHGRGDAAGGDPATAAAPEAKPIKAASGRSRRSRQPPPPLRRSVRRSGS